MTINFQNVKKDQVGNFVECSYDNCFIYSDLPYECDSIMHYYDTAFNTGGKLLALDFFSGLGIRSFPLWLFALSLYLLFKKEQWERRYLLDLKVKSDGSDWLFMKK